MSSFKTHNMTYSINLLLAGNYMFKTDTIYVLNMFNPNLGGILRGSFLRWGKGGLIYPPPV